MKQNNRDIILKDIDLNKVVSNEDLFLYELTPYYKFNDNDDTFFDKIIKYQNDVNRMVHNPKISFMPEQKRVFDRMIEDGRYALSATTSFGKTTLIKEYIKLKQPKIVVFVVPTNSLADELLSDFEILFLEDGYDIIDTSVTKLNIDENRKIIFIGTQEKLVDISWLKEEKIDLFVIDEAYKLKDELVGNREISLNRVFLDFLNNSSKFILLLPLVNSITGLDKFDIELIKTDYSPVTKTFEGIDTENFDNEIVEVIKKNEEKSLIYFGSPASLENFFWDKIYPEHMKDKYNDEWIKRVEKDFHSEWFPVIAYKKGIAIHYGNMPKFVQIRMVKLFNKSQNFNNVLSTSSLIEGVNTPTKNIYIKDHLIFSIEHRIKYKNLIGRAGRLNVTPVGKIYYDDQYQNEFKQANMNWENIDIRLIIEEESVLEDINREESSARTTELVEKYELKYDDVVDYLEKSGMTINQLNKLIEKLISYNKDCQEHYFPSSTTNLYDLYNKCCYSENRIMKYNLPLKPKKEGIKVIALYTKEESKHEKEYKKQQHKFMRTLLSVTINSTIGGEMMYDISSMLDYINKEIVQQIFKHNNSKVVSSIIGMIYSFLPYELIPLLENIVELNNIFQNSGKSLVDDKIVDYINAQIGKYNIKYFGKAECTEKERKIIKRLFEYGIPYSKIKLDINYLVENVPNNFSINHIKRAIEENDDLKNKLSKYFE